MREDCRRYLEIRFAERPGHVLKWPLSMENMKVYLTGMKAAAWKYWASSHLVVSCRKMPLTGFG